MTKLTKIFLLFIFCLNIFFVLSSPIYAQETGLTKPKLQISIPSLHFGEGFSNNKGAWIGEYIKAIYNYSMTIVGILAAVVLMFAGVIWLTAGGNASRVDDAKKWITASLTGLIIALTSYMILNIVNPDLTIFKSLDIKTIEQQKSEGVKTTTRKEGNIAISTLSNGTTLHVSDGEVLKKDAGMIPLKREGEDINKIRGKSTIKVFQANGSLEFQFIPKLADFIDETEKKGYNIRITSLNDGIHDGGTHQLGRGADISGLSATQAKEMGDWWVNQGTGRRYINNYSDGHLHIDLGYPPK